MYGQLASKSLPQGPLYRHETENRFEATWRHQPCLECGLQHPLVDCSAFLKRTPVERVELLRRYNICFSCLRPDHMAKRCKARKPCTVPGCDKTHHPLIHVSTADEKLDLKISNCVVRARTPVCLRCIPVRLQGPKGIVSTYALIDNGSDATLLKSDLAERLGLSCDPCELNISTVSGKKCFKSSKAALEILAIDSESSVLVKCAYTVPNLPVSEAGVPSKFDIEKWSHLNGLELKYIPDRSIGILIGCDVPEVHTVLEQKVGVGNQPYAVKSILGWSIRGPAGTSCTALRHVNGINVKQTPKDEVSKGISDKVDVKDRLISVGTQCETVTLLSSLRNMLSSGKFYSSKLVY